MIFGLLYAIGGVIEAIIGLRFVFRLLGVNPANEFVHWVYSFSAPFVAPFAGIFGHSASVTGQGVVTTSVFDWSALVAFIVIGLIVGFVGSIFARSRLHPVA